MSFFLKKFSIFAIMKRALIRQHIIQTASDLFYTNGYNRTGINEIIKEANIAKATLYNHFKSKEDICVAYLKFKNETFLKSIKSFIEAKPNGEEKILGLFDFLESFFNSDKFNGCWCINTVSEIPKSNLIIKSEILSQKKALINYISNLIHTQLKNYEDTECISLANKIYLLYEGAVSESNLQDNVWPIHSAKSICKQIL